MSILSDIYTTLIDRRNGPGLLRNPNTADTPGYALIGNILGGGVGGLFPNSGIQENRINAEWEMGCISWENGGVAPQQGPIQEGQARLPAKKAIKFRVNPSDVSWSMPQRSQEQKTKAGTVLHVWNDNERRTYYDEPVLTLNLQTGNILPVRDIFNPTRPVVPDGLSNFYEFMALVDEVKVLSNGRANLCYIDYKSLIFPAIRLWGFFSPTGISFTDNSNNPATVNSWTASFTVYKTDWALGRGIATRNDSIIDGSLAGLPAKEAYSRAGYPYRNRRSETFGILEDAATTVFAAGSGQVAPRDIAKAGKATVQAASRRITTRLGTALAGAVANTTSGASTNPRFSGSF